MRTETGRSTFGGCGRAVGALLRQPIRKGAKLQFPEQFDDRLAVVVADVAAIEVDGDRQVAHDRRQKLAPPGLVDAGGQRVLCPCRGDLVQVGDDLLDPAVLADKCLGRLFADPGHAGDVVRGIADQRLVVGDVLRPEPVAGMNRRRIEIAQIAKTQRARQDDRRVVVHELEQIAVAGHDDDPHIALLGADAGEAADDIVRLVPFALLDGDVERVDELPHPLDLGPQIVGHGAAIRLVLGVLIVAEGPPAFHGDDGVLRIFPPQHVEQHRRESEDRVDDFPLRSRNLVLDRVVGAENQPVAIHQQQDRPFVAGLIGGGRASHRTPR